MNPTSWILWLFLANGNVVVVQHEYATLDDCLETQRIVQNYQAATRTSAVDHILCLPGDERRTRAGAQ
jgi:hypothetical protein